MTGPRRAFSLIEVVVAIAIIGLMLVGALSAVSASRGSQFKVRRLRQAHLLGQALMAEILQQDYEETAGVLGPDPDELSGVRAGFDDVDDYDGWSQSPPQREDGTNLDQFASYGRRVTIAYLNPGSLWQTVPFDSGIKRIIVCVDVNGNEIVSLTAVRTRGRDSLTP